MRGPIQRWEGPERDHVTLLDFDPAVTGLPSQPSRLFRVAENGKGIPHAPDCFARRQDGSAIVVDCRPADRRKPRDRVKFEATQKACDPLGGDSRLAGTPEDPILVAHVWWPAGYRHPRHRLELVVSMLRNMFAEPQPFMAAPAWRRIPSLCCRCSSTCCGGTNRGGSVRPAARHPARVAGGAVMPQGDAFVLRPGDRVSFDDGDHQVVALSRTSVRLRPADGAETAVWLPT